MTHTFFKNLSRLTSVLLCITTSLTSAHIEPTHVISLNYQPGQTVFLCGDPRISTQVILAPTEQIIEVTAGNTRDWHVHVSSPIKHVLDIKPIKAHPHHTNLNMITEAVDTQQHYFYHFDLLACHLAAQRTSSAWYAIHLIRASHSIKTSTRLTRPLHHNQYTFHGPLDKMPQEVFDDGQFTYLKLRQGQSIPAVFAVNNPQGEEMLVNTRRSRDYLLITQVAPQWTLRYGHSVASLFNTPIIHHLVKTHKTSFSKQLNLPWGGQQ